MDESLCEILEDLKKQPADNPFDKDLIKTAQDYFNLFSTVGFEESVLHHLVSNVLSLERLTHVRFRNFLFCCLPLETVNVLTVEEVFKHLLLWRYSTRAPYIDRCRVCLQYLIGLTKYRLVPPDYFDGTYLFLYNFLEHKALQSLAAELIYYTTTYSNLTPWCVSQVQRRMILDGHKHSLLALMSLFKRMKVHLVMYDVSVLQNEEGCFSEKDETFKERLLEAQARRNIRVGSRAVEDAEDNQIVMRSGCYSEYLRCYPEFESLKSFLEFYGKCGSYTCGSSYEAILTHDFNFMFVVSFTEVEATLVNYYLTHRLKQCEYDKDPIHPKF